MDGNFTLFKSGSGSGNGGASDYVADVFEDVSNPASTNQGLTDTTLTNPLQRFFANNDTPQHSNKTLFVKDLILLKDRSQWVKSRPTYIVEFNENMPGVFAYVYGNVRLRNQKFGLCVDIKDIGDGFGVTGVVRDVMWGFNVSASTATAQAITDQVAGLTLSFGGAAADLQSHGVNTWYYLKHQAALSTDNIHDFRVEANEYGTLSIGSIQVYFENAANTFQFYPGTTYIDKFKATTTSGAGASLPIMAGKLGAETLALKTQSNTYSLNTTETPYISSIGIGASGSNLIDVSTGQGGSFPVGTGIVGVQGTSFYLGSVVSLSTDTLTVSPTLTFGVSGLVYKTWATGPTLPIGATLYSLKETIDIATQNNYLDDNGFVKPSNGNLYWSNPQGDYRLWGKDFAQSSIEGYPGLGFFGNTNAFLQLDFKGSALDFEMAGNGILHGTFAINGVPVFGLNEGFTGVIKKTILTDGGPGWKSMVFTPGQSFINCEFINFGIYQRLNPGITAGILADFETAQDKVYRYTHNASMMSLGPYQRVYGDNLFFSGNWARGLTTSQAGGVCYIGATNSCALQFGYYGNDFSILGSFGTSTVVLFDGASLGVTANALKQVSGITFHTIEFQHKGGTSVISAIDFSSPQTLEVRNDQNYLPRPELADIAPSFYQSDTPREARQGALWSKDVNNGPVFIRLGNRWLQVDVTASFDDPNGQDTLFFKTHGLTVPSDTTTVTGDTEQFNFVSWMMATSDTSQLAVGGIGDQKLGNKLYYVDGLVSGGSDPTLNTRVYNKIIWATGTNRTVAKLQHSSAVLNGKLCYSGGATSGAGAANNTIETFDGTTWASVTTVDSGADIYTRGCFAVAGLVNFVGGYVSGVAETATVDTFDGTTSAAGVTAPVARPWTGSASCAGGNGFVTSPRSTSTDSYTFDGVTWSTLIVATYGAAFDAANSTLQSLPSSGFNAGSNMSYVSNGAADTGTPLATSEQFNGTVFASAPSSSLARSASSGGVI